MIELKSFICEAVIIELMLINPCTVTSGDSRLAAEVKTSLRVEESDEQIRVEILIRNALIQLVTRLRY